MTIVDDVRKNIDLISATDQYINPRAFYQPGRELLKPKREFPWKRNFIDVDAMYENLIEFEPRVTEYKGVILNTGKPKPGFLKYFGMWKGTPVTTFDGKVTGFKTEPSDYARIDNITDYFTEQQRMSCNVRGHKSPLRRWEDEDDLPRKLDETDQKELRDLIWKETKECTSFKVTLARSVYLFFNAKKTLDISSGWGDRLIAAISCGVRYTGFDPNETLQGGYREIIDRFDGDASVTPLPFEDAVIEGKYDLVFTSPPFSNYEEYRGSANTSTLRYPNFTDWIFGFLFTSLAKAWKRLERGGNMVIHLSDTSSDMSLATVEPMMLYVNGWFGGAKFRGVLFSTGGLSGQARPMWVWAKTDQNDKEAIRRSRKQLEKLYPGVYNKI